MGVKDLPLDIPGKESQRCSEPADGFPITARTTSFGSVQSFSHFRSSVLLRKVVGLQLFLLLAPMGARSKAVRRWLRFRPAGPSADSVSFPTGLHPTSRPPRGRRRQRQFAIGKCHHRLRVRRRISSKCGGGGGGGGGHLLLDSFVLLNSNASFVPPGCVPVEHNPPLQSHRPHKNARRSHSTAHQGIPTGSIPETSLTLNV